MAPPGFALETQQRARFLGRKFAQLLSRDNRLGQVELPRVNTLQIGMPPFSCGLATFGRRAERFQIHIVDPCFGQSVGKDIFGETGLSRKRHGAHIDHPLHPGRQKRGNEFGLGRPFIANGKDAHHD